MPWAHTTQFHAWVTKCVQTRVKSNLVPILQHWNRDHWKKPLKQGILTLTQQSEALCMVRCDMDLYLDC